MSLYGGDGIMTKLLRIVCVAACLGVWIAPARAAPTTVTFEALPDVPFNMYVEGLATFTAVDGGLLKRDTAPNLTWALRAVTEPYPEMRADIAGGASFVSVDLGDFAGIDTETVFLEIFGAVGHVARVHQRGRPDRSHGHDDAVPEQPLLRLCRVRGQELDRSTMAARSAPTISPSSRAPVRR